MTHASLFSGIGGPEVAAVMLDWRNAFHCDINPFGRAVLEYWFPNSESYGDIKTTDFKKWQGKIDVLTGGFPCQPFSYAGKRKGADDDRYLWPEFKRVISEVRPTWVIGENVAGIVSMVEPGEIAEMANQASMFEEDNGVRGYRQEKPFTIERVCSDLESLGYSVQPILIPACAVGAPHRRDRVFIIARDVTSNANHDRDVRVAIEDEGEGGEERNEVRKSDEPNQVRRESEVFASDDIGGGSEACEKNGGFKGERCIIPQQGERREPSQWSDRFYAILRHASDTASIGGREIYQHLQPQWPNGSEPFGNGGEWPATNTEEQCGEWLRSEQSENSAKEQKQFGGGSLKDDNKGVYPDANGSLLQCRNSKGSSDCKSGLRIKSLDSKAGLGRWGTFPAVSPVHRGNDGLPFNVDDLTISFSKWRTESLKAYGNAIVPQVMYEIFRCIDLIEN